MKKVNKTWSIKTLQKNIDLIEFPEFQRESTVWNLTKKRQLIDSILREFDIATIYLHKRDDGIYECIDGRQRINAITSFLGLNEVADNVQDASRYDNKFKFISSDELLGSTKLELFDHKTFSQFEEEGLENHILDYELNILEITEIGDEVEEGEEDNSKEILSLMFLRLQLGDALNGGEKLNAMRGDMRNLIFHSDDENSGLGQHPYFEFLKIPKRRFSKELTAAQIAINFFSLQEKDGFKRARFFDLQIFFSANAKFDDKDRETATKLRLRLDQIHNYVKDFAELHLKNRALGVSTFFFINELLDTDREGQIFDFIEFLQQFLKVLKEEVEKGIDIDLRDLLKFQTYISQAAVEKYAIENRQKFLSEYFEFWRDNRKIKGKK